MSVELSDPLIQVLLYPMQRVPASELQRIEDKLIELGAYDSELPIEPEYWKGDTQYHPMIHPNESRRKPHIVLKGRNCFPHPIRKRAGDGGVEEVPPGGAFKTHVPVYLYG